MIIPVKASELFNQKFRLPLIDVRSPAEFSQGHIPGAINIPLFSDNERAEVGTRYKQAGRDAALLIGLDFVGVNMSGFVKKLNALCRGLNKEVILYCWRGGMRSASMAWLFSTAGYKVSLIEGGYKAYRNYIRAESGNGMQMIVLGGMTGSGKTEILCELQKMDQQVIDLEKLANHKGSVFGHLGQPLQPTNEQFENNLFDHLQTLDFSKPVWIEDESRSIGTVSMPGPFFDRMKSQPMILLEVPVDIRVERLVEEYAAFDKSLLIDALSKISQPIGKKEMTEIVNDIGESKFIPAIRLVLRYYDRMYGKALDKFNGRKIFHIKTESCDAKLNAQLLFQFVSKEVFTLMV